MKNKQNLTEFFEKVGLRTSQHIIVHSSFRKIKSAFSELTPNLVISVLKNVVGSTGSVVFPTFTYCYKKLIGGFEIFDLKNSRSKVGLLSEAFRLSEDVIRTSSPTHSFALWGEIKNYLDTSNSPKSPLGKESVLEWLTNKSQSYILMLGTDFSALTYGHYLEVKSQVPWYDYSPWDYLNILPIGVSIKGEQKLKEISGCSKSFINFEKYLLDHNLIVKKCYSGLESYLISIEDLYYFGVKYFKENFESLLCRKGTCHACDTRRIKFIQS